MELYISKPSYLAAASLFTSKETRHYYLTGVSIEPIPNETGIYIVATDGHRLAVFKDSEGAVSEKIIVQVSKNLFAATKYSPKRDRSYIQLDQRSDLLNVFQQEIDASSGDFNDIHTHVEPLQLVKDSSYAPWKKVVPSPKAVDKMTASSSRDVFNAAYLADFKKIQATAFGAKENYVRLLDGDGSPALITTSHPDFFGILMPIRSSFSPNIYPPFAVHEPVHEPAPEPEAT